MELPEFNPSGTGPQGSGGIPLDSVREGSRATGTDLAGSAMRPEDYPAAQAFLDREAATIAEALGLTDKPAPSPTTEAVAAPAPADTPTQVTQPSPVAAPSQVAGTQEEFNARVAALKSKYGDGPEGFENLAQSYLAANRKMTEATQERSTVVTNLERQITALTDQVQQMRTSFSPTPVASKPTATPSDETPEEFWKNPKPQIAEIVGNVVKEHLSAYERAQAERLQADRIRDQLTKNQAEIERLTPVMDQLYSEDRNVYDALPKDVAVLKLLKDARTQDIANRGVKLYQEFFGTTTPAPSAPTSGASVPSGGGTTRLNGTPAANGNYAKTEGMKQLWRVAGGGFDEDRALMKVLEERGFYTT